MKDVFWTVHDIMYDGTIKTASVPDDIVEPEWRRMKQRGGWTTLLELPDLIIMEYGDRNSYNYGLGIQYSVAVRDA